MTLSLDSEVGYCQQWTKFLEQGQKEVMCYDSCIFQNSQQLLSPPAVWIVILHLGGLSETYCTHLIIANQKALEGSRIAYVQI